MKTKGNHSFVLLLSVALFCAWSFPVAALADGDSAVIASFNMDSDPGWTTEGQWEYGQPQGVGGDPSSGYTGANVYGYNLAGQHPNGMPKYWLTTLPMDCSNYTNVVLKFQRWLGVEHAYFDHADIQVSNDGSTWQQIWANPNSIINDSAWKEMSYDISAVADTEPNVYIRWGMGPTDSVVTYCGWNIDDVELTGMSVLQPDMLPDEDYIVHAYLGDPVIPSSTVYTISNSSSSAIDWVASASESWISVSPSGPGALYPGESLGLTVTLDVNAHDFTLGSHTGTVTVLHINENEEVVRNVGVHIYSPPQPPVDPVLVAPTNSAGGIVVNTILDWDHDSGTVLPSPLVNTTSTYSVYFGTSATNLVQIVTGLTNTLYDPGLLETDTTFYWQVIASNAVGVTTGSLWSFTTWKSGPLDHFVWSEINSNQQVSVPFDAVVTAQDVYGDTVVDFDGSVPIGGYKHMVGEHEMFENVAHQNSGSSSSDSRGLRFRVDEDISITHLQHYRGTNISLWADDGELLYEAAITNAQGSWSETALENPIFLYRGQVYRISCEGGSYYRLYDDTPRNFDHGQILNSCYSSAGFPSSLYSSYMDLVDFRYAVGHQDPIEILPTNAVEFVGGVWSGRIVVAEYVQEAFLRAESTNGVRGDSGAFSADYIGDLNVTLPDNVDEGYGILLNVGEVMVSIMPASNLVVNLSFDPGAEATVPAQVVIPAGETNVLFDLTILDDALLDGSRTSLLHAVSFGYKSASAMLPVHDNESATLMVSVPSTSYEGAGSIAGAIIAGAAPDVDVVVHLISNNPSEVGSGSVVIPAGQIFASFTLPVYDDNVLDGIQTATIEAHVENWQSGYASVFVFDDEANGIDLQLLASVIEGGGLLPNAGSVALPTAALADVHVLLSPSDLSELTLPPYVTIPAGQLSAMFDVSVVDDAETDGTVTLSVLAQAPGYIPDSSTISVLDNDAHHLDIDELTDELSLFESAVITVSATTIDGLPASSFTGPVVLSASGDRGAVAVSPDSITSFVDGMGSLSVTFGNIGNDVKLLAEGGSGIAGTSTVFNVIGSQIAISPANLTNTLVVAGATATRSMVVSNAGNANLEFEIQVFPVFTNLVINGNFEEGNSGFTSTYAYTPGADSQAKGIYTVADDSKTWNGSFATTMKDHTSGGGQMLMANGDSTGTAVVWQQEVPVVAGVTYDVSAWAASLFGEFLPALNFQVNGASVGSITTEHLTWTEFSTQWTATSSGTVTFSIVDTQFLPPFLPGNHFAIDDIVLQPIGWNEVELDLGLVAHYPFNGNANDESGNGYDGTLIGATLMTNRFGKVGSACYFDGVNDRIDLPSAVLNFERTNLFSHSFWIKTDDVDGGNIIAKMQSSSIARGVNVVLANGLLRVQLISYNAINNKIQVEGTTPLSDDEWHHVVVTYDGSSSASGVIIYIDGYPETKTVVRDSLTGTIINSTTPTIGSRNSGYYYNGGIDDVRIYNRALSVAEVAALYTSNDDGSNPSDISWLSADPASGIIPPGSNMAVSAIFDAAGMVAGDHSNATLMVTCNDVVSPSYDVLTSMYMIPEAPVMDAEPETTYGSSNAVSWRAINGPVTYLVEVATDTVSAALQQSGWLEATNHTFNALAINQMYYYRARASVESNIGRLNGPWSGWVWSTQLPALADADEDGIPDWWEELHFGGVGVAGLSTDSDGDGQSDYDEFIAGMIPTNPSSYFMINDASMPTNGPFVIYWDAATGRVYSVHWKASMTNAFTPMATNIFYPQGSYTDEVHQADDCGFYRIGVELQ